VECPNCEQRKFYYSADVHDPKQDDELIPRHKWIQFGKRKGGYIQPQSLMNEWVSWLQR
jgi:hypothetical protein